MIEGEILDIFGHIFKPGDIFLYAPTSQKSGAMKIGVFVGSKFYGEDLQHYAEVQFVSFNGKPPCSTLLMASIMLEKSAIVHCPEMFINSQLIQDAIKIIETLKDQGVL